MLSRTMADREGGEDNPQPGQPSRCGVMLWRVVGRGGRARAESGLQQVGVQAARALHQDGRLGTFSPGNLINIFSIYAPKFLSPGIRLKIHGISLPGVEPR